MNFLCHRAVEKRRSPGGRAQAISYFDSDTALRAARAGDAVNLETDLLGKYVARHLALHGHSTLTLDKLRSAGFAD